MRIAVGAPLEAQMAAQTHAVDVAAEHDVEDGDVIGKARTQGLERLLTAQGDVDRHAGFRQPSREAGGDLRLVLDDEYAHVQHRMRGDRRAPVSASDSILALDE